MIKVECYSGYRINERPLKFTLQDRAYQVTKILDSWYGETSQYFKVEADDQNIYLLKYDNYQDQWDLIFYQDTRKMDILMPPGNRVKPAVHPLHETAARPNTRQIN